MLGHKIWSSRLRLFGPDRFHLPMTLRGALRDDLDALERGIFQLPPEEGFGPGGKDAAGRKVVLVDFVRYDRNICSRESMLRASWYTLESALEDPASLRGLVILGRFKNFTLQHNDFTLEKAVLELERLYLPLKFSALQLHCCCIPTAVMRLLKHAMYGNFDRRTRCRLLVHDVDRGALPAVLGGYGVPPEAIPGEERAGEAAGAGGGSGGGGDGDWIQRQLAWLRGRIAQGK